MEAHEKYLEQQTNGKIHGRFRSIGGVQDVVIRKITKEEIRKHTYSAYLSRMVKQAPQSVKEQGREMPPEPELRDANSLYEEEPEFFCFQIYNSSYQFNMLKLELSPAYPINIWPDSGILDGNDPAQFRLQSKIGTDNSGEYIIRVISDQDLVDVLRILFSSKKVQYILYRMIKMDSEAEDRQNAKTPGTE